MAPLAASAAPIVQIAPTANTATTSDSSTFSDFLLPTTDVNDLNNAITYSTSTVGSPLSVSAAGVITNTGGTLAAGPYTVSGTDSEVGGDSGTWSYTLTVSGVAITQTAPLSGSTTTSGSSGFTAQLKPTLENGVAVTYSTSTVGSPLSVSAAGAITNTGGTLAAGPYTVSGTDSDSFGDTGTWSFALTVTGGAITQTAPLSGSTTTSGSSGFTAQLEPTTNVNRFTTTTANVHLRVSSSGAVTTSGGPLSANSYTVSGSDADNRGDHGSWSYTLTVTGAVITQTAPFTSTTTTSGSSAFTAQLEPTANANAFTTTAANANLHVSSSGAVTTSGAPLSANSYAVSGRDTNNRGDHGSWSYTLTVTGGVITQTAPLTASTTSSGSSTFTDQLEPTTNANTFSTTTPNANLHVSSSGAVTTSGGPLSANSYTLSGTDLDAFGDTGSWSYTLVVSAPANGPPPTTIVTVIPTSPPSGVTLNQTSPTSGVTTPSNSAIFTSGPITVNNATGLVSFATSSSSTALKVSVEGAISTTGPLTAGTYGVSGSDSDPGGDTGTWSYTLTVSSRISLTFKANGGQGAMSRETKSAPTALTPNAFTRAKHVFVRWNSAPDGSGTNYTNGAVYPFTKSITLFAIWKATTKIVATKTVAFNANGGSGSMLSESKDVLASLDANGFTRKGSTFTRWSTKANGSGSSYANGAVYQFKKSITLYAQWTAMATTTVTFKANGGSGLMPSETKSTQAALTGNKFRRHEYAFAGWSTRANGLGSNYANDAAYQFKKSITLYAQWRAVKVVVNPALNAVRTLGPFADKSATLSPTLEAQITVLANEIVSYNDTKIALVGFSSDLTTSNALNEATWGAALQLSRQRALAVETYLELQLASLGVTGYTITASQSGKAIPDAENATAANRAKNNKVVATLT
jgi:outer membrane protein OmpA-like peptidoglycan-associated protein